MPESSGLTKFTVEELAAAVELNHAEWLRIEGALPWVEFHDDGDVLWLFAGDTWPRNSAALTRFTATSAHRRVGEILAHHLKRKVACNWVVGPVSQPADLGKHLRAHGFRCMIHCAGMACDLNELPPTLTTPKGARIELADDPPSLQPLTTERRQRRHEGRNAMTRVTPQQVWCFAASVDDRPVGETLLCAGAGVAGIYDVVVLEGFRRRGIGTALVSAALWHAGKLGYRAAVLAATGMGAGRLCTARLFARSASSVSGNTARCGSFQFLNERGAGSRLRCEVRLAVTEATAAGQSVFALPALHLSSYRPSSPRLLCSRRVFPWAESSVSRSACQ